MCIIQSFDHKYLILLLYLGHSQLQPFLFFLAGWLQKHTDLGSGAWEKTHAFLFSPHSCYNWTWIQVFVGIERHFTCPDFPFWSWLRPRQCQILIQRSLGHFLYCAEALTSPQAHVAFNGWTLQSTADLLFAKGAPRRKQKSLACAQDRSLTAVLQWTELCMTACNPPFQTGKQSAHSGFARYLPHLQLL